MRTASTCLLAALLLSSAVEAAPRPWVRDVVISTGWRWGQAPSDDFPAILREEVDARLASCAAGRDLRLDLRIERLDVRRPGDLRPSAGNRLVAQVKVRNARDRTVIDLQRIEVFTPDDGALALVRDPEIVLSEAAGDAICKAFFPQA